MSHALHKLVKWSYLLIALSLILLAVLVQSGRSFSPLLGNYNQDIAEYLSTKLNAQVSIGSMQAEWVGLKPNLVVRDVVVKSYDDQPIVALKHARLRLDLLGSLLNLRFVWSNLTLQQVDMTFTQTIEGFWQIPGLPHLRNAVHPDQHARPDALVDMLLLSRRIEFQHSHLNFEFSNGQHVVLNSPSLMLENAGDFHRLSLQVDVDKHPRSVSLVIEGQGDPRDQENFHSRGYLQLNRFPTSEPIAAATAFLLGGRPGLDAQGQVDATIWFNTREEDEGYNVVGSVGIQRLALPLGGQRRLMLDDFATELTGFWRPGGQWRLGLQQLNVSIADKQVSGLNIGAAADGYGKNATINMDHIDLQRLNQLLASTEALGNERLHNVLQTLNPRGHLRNLQLHLPIKSPREWQLRANLDQIGVNALQGVPALVGVDGYLQVGQTGGFVDIDSQRHFSMHYSPTYDKPMIYDSARGQVAWRLQPEENQIYVNSGLLEFRQGSEVARGYMWLGLPWKRNTGDIDLFLQIGGQRLAANSYEKYTPATIPATLADWLDKSIGMENPGLATTAGFVYRGTLNTKNPLARTFQLYLDLNGASLNYHPGWPAIKAIQGRLLVTDSRIAASVAAAKLLDSEISDAELQVNPAMSWQGSLLTLDAQIKGPAADGLRILREGEMRKFLGASLDSWMMQGTMDASIQLDIPIGEKGEGHRQQIAVDLQAPLFELQNLNLQATDVNGQIRYNSETGVSSEHLRGNVFGNPLEVKLRTQKGKRHNKTIIDLDGSVDARKLAFWSKRPELLFMTGDLPYKTVIELNHRPGLAKGLSKSTPADPLAQSVNDFYQQAFATVTVTSDLQGVVVDLPAPYGKAATDQRSLVFRYSLQEAEAQVQFAYAQDVQGVLRLARPENTLIGANIALHSEARLAEEERFIVSGYIPELDLEQLKDVQRRYLAFTEQVTPAIAQPLNAHRSLDDIEALMAAEAAAIGRVAGLPFRADIVIGSYELGSVVFKDLILTAVPVQAGWGLTVRNAQVAGNILVPSNSLVPLDINLEYLALTIPPPDYQPLTGAAVDHLPPAPKAEQSLLDPHKIPLANIAVKSLTLDGNQFGTWSLQCRPNDQGVLIDQIKGNIRGLTISGIQGKPGAQVLWQYTPAGMQTRFIGSLTATDIGAVLRDWNKPDTIESNSAQFTANVYWRGSPQEFALTELGGEMTIHMENGRFKREANAGDGILRLLSILNFDSLARRMRLDFSDLYKSGLAYDHIDGKVHFNQGTIVFAGPLVVRTPSSGLQLAGTINLRDETINTRLVATLPVASNLTFFAALATGLPAAAGIYLVSKLFKKQVDQATSISYQITGSWDDPKMRFDRLFESEQSLREKADKGEKEKPPP